MSEIDRIQLELKLAGYDVEDQGFDYNNMVAKHALEICKLFCSQGHSGFSAAMCREMVYKLLSEELLTPLTNSKEEWTNVSDYAPDESLYQSKRKYSCFSDDGLRTYYDSNEIDEDGKRIYHPLPSKEEVLANAAQH